MKKIDKNLLQLILEEGEGYKIEFKEKLSGLDINLKGKSGLMKWRI